MGVCTFRYRLRRSHAFGCFVHSWARYFALLPILIVVYYYCLTLFYVQFFGARDFKKHPIAQLPRRQTLMPEGVRYESDRGESTLLWRDFIKWRADGKLILAYLSPRLFMIYPSRLTALGFPMEHLNEKLTQEVGPPKR